MAQTYKSLANTTDTTADILEVVDFIVDNDITVGGTIYVDTIIENTVGNGVDIENINITDGAITGATSINLINTGTDNKLARYNNTNEIQPATTITIDDTDNITGVASLTATSLVADSLTAKTTNGNLSLAGNGTGYIYLNSRTYANNHIAPLVDNSYLLGFSAYRWFAVYAVNYIGELITTLPNADLTITGNGTGRVIIESITVDGGAITNATSINLIGTGTDNYLARYNGTTAIQKATAIIVDDTDNITGVASINLIGTGTDNYLARYNGTTAIQKATAIIVDDTDNITGVASLSTTTLYTDTISEKTLSNGVNIENMNINDYTISNVQALYGSLAQDMYLGINYIAFITLNHTTDSIECNRSLYIATGKILYTNEIQSYTTAGVFIESITITSGAITGATSINLIGTGTDNYLVRYDGTASIQKATAIIVDDTDNMTGIASLTATSLIADSLTSKTTNGDLTLVGNGTGSVAVNDVLKVNQINTYSGTYTTISGYFYVDTSGTPTIYCTSGTYFRSNNIGAYTTDSDLTISGNGTGNVSCSDKLTITGNAGGIALNITGGTTQCSGDVYPSTTDTYDLGTSTYRWQEGHIRKIYGYGNSNTDYPLLEYSGYGFYSPAGQSPSNTAVFALYFNSSQNKQWGFYDGAYTANSDTILRLGVFFGRGVIGACSKDATSIKSLDCIGNFLPFTTTTYDLGSTTYRWDYLYNNNINIAGTTQATCAKIIFNGQEALSASQTRTAGIQLHLGVNRATSKQLVVGDSERQTSSDPAIRFWISSSNAEITGVDPTLAGAKPLTIRGSTLTLNGDSAVYLQYNATTKATVGNSIFYTTGTPVEARTDGSSITFAEGGSSAWIAGSFGRSGTSYEKVIMGTYPVSPYTNNPLIGGHNYNFTSWVTLYAANLSSVVISDRRTKTNIQDSTHKALDTINNIKIREFDWADNKHTVEDKKGKHEDFGIVADELETVLPSAVSDFESFGEIIKVVKGGFGDPAYILLIKAIQEQQAIIQQLTDTIQQLTQRISLLEEKK